MRSLLSENLIRYETIEKTAEGMKARVIEREGPTGLIVTTTAASLHSENETRLISIPVDDSAHQTKAVMRAIARQNGQAVDMTEWHDLQLWLTDGERRVEVRFAAHLAEAVPPVAVRLRRDFGAVLGLIRAHGLLHRATRDTDENGAVIATIEDYRAVRELVVDLVSEGVSATVSPQTRETVEGVATLAGEDSTPVSTARLADRLRIDKSAASRRVRVAIDKGYLRNDEDRRGRPAKLACADPLPEDVEILPTADDLRDSCSVASETGGIDTPTDAHSNGWTEEAAGQFIEKALEMFPGSVELSSEGANR
jgi:hypothetical protein